MHGRGSERAARSLRHRTSRSSSRLLHRLNDCDVCTHKMQCCPTTPARQVPRDINEYARDVARRTMRTKAFLKSRDERKRVEMRFAHLKIHHGFEQMRLRGLSKPPTSSTASTQSRHWY